MVFVGCSGVGAEQACGSCDQCEMLIQSSLPNSISIELSFATDNGQLNMDSLCDWSNCGETWQKSVKFDEYPSDNCNEATSTGEEESKLSSTSIVELSRTCSDLSAVNDMCASSAPKRDGYVYKRRKLQRNSVALLPEENAKETTKRNAGYHSITSSVDHPLIVPNEDLDRAPTAFIDSNDILDNGNPSISRRQHLEKPASLPMSQINDSGNVESVENILTDNRCSIREEELPVESSRINLRKSAPEHDSGINDSCSSSKSNIGHASTLVKAEVEDIAQCSSPDNVVVESQESISVKELCISVLKSHGLLGGAWATDACAALEVLGIADANCFQSCKVCGRLDNALKMLICDLCEEAFHMSCCIPKVKKPPQVDEWYCPPCFKKRLALKNSSGRSFNIVGKMSKHMNIMSDEDLGPISFMLRDNVPYKMRARIGNNYQAEVLEWSGPVSDDNNNFDEPVELEHSECASLNDWNFKKPLTIGNWLQCREVIYKDTHDNEGTVCGKWRRAPLSEEQTDEWDCSCALVWDAIHADCAVPQELETDIVLKHLKYVEKWRSLLASNKQKTD